MTVIDSLEYKIWLALKNRLSDWGETPVYYDNEVYTPLANRPYVLAQYVGLDSGFAGLIGRNCGDDHRRLLNLSIFTPIGQGYDMTVMLGYAGRLSDHMWQVPILYYDDATIEITDRPTIVGNSMPNPPWNRLELQVNCRAWG